MAHDDRRPRTSDRGARYASRCSRVTERVRARLMRVVVCHTAWLSTCWGACSWREGRKTETTVQLFPGAVLLFKRMEPWCLSTIFLQTQSPNPVPTSFLVVKKGSKTSSRADAGIPDPVSATVMRTPLVWCPL